MIDVIDFAGKSWSMLTGDHGFSDENGAFLETVAFILKGDGNMEMK